MSQRHEALQTIAHMKGPDDILGDAVNTARYALAKKEQRFRFVSDDDGYDYLIPAELEKEFDEWVVENVVHPKIQGDFDQYRTRMSPNNYTFTDPKEDK